jgi:predicted metal-dependent hydrolase
MLDWLRKRPEPRRRGGAVRSTVSVGGRDLPLKIRRLRTARQMTLRLAPDGSEARVTLPPWGAIGDAEGFARDRADWLARQLTQLPQRDPPGPGGSVLYRGRRLSITWRPQAPRNPVAGDHDLVLGGPEARVTARLRRWLEGEALRLFAADLEDYCPRAGVTLRTVRLSRAARRWGSCAADGTIRLNWRLVMAPDEVRRSVVAHEVAHLSHFDHSPRFHAHMADLFEGDLAAANRWLKQHGRSLYADFG